MFKKQSYKLANLVGCGCCSEGDACGRCCCCRHSGWRSAVHHGNFRKENHISKHTEECSSMGKPGQRVVESSSMVFVSAEKPCDEMPPPASDMQSQCKAGEHSRQQGEGQGRGEMEDESRRGEEREGKKAHYHQCKFSNIIKLNHFHLYSSYTLKLAPLVNVL